MLNPKSGLAALVASISLATPACATDALSQLDELTKAYVNYSMTSQALAAGAQCRRASGWLEYDRKRLLETYQASRDYLERHSPGDRFEADFQTHKLVRDLQESSSRGEKTLFAYCNTMADSYLQDYR